MSLGSNVLPLQSPSPAPSKASSVESSERAEEMIQHHLPPVPPAITTKKTKNGTGFVKRDSNEVMRTMSPPPR